MDRVFGHQSNPVGPAIRSPMCRWTVALSRLTASDHSDDNYMLCTNLLSNINSRIGDRNLVNASIGGGNSWLARYHSAPSHPTRRLAKGKPQPQTGCGPFEPSKLPCVVVSIQSALLGTASSLTVFRVRKSNTKYASRLLIDILKPTTSFTASVLQLDVAGSPARVIVHSDISSTA